MTSLASDNLDDRDSGRAPPALESFAEASPARRGPIGLCLDCGYSLRGLPTPRCPECGRQGHVARYARASPARGQRPSPAPPRVAPLTDERRPCHDPLPWDGACAACCR